jgi:hypothetical protein
LHVVNTVRNLIFPLMASLEDLFSEYQLVMNDDLESISKEKYLVLT